MQSFNIFLSLFSSMRWQVGGLFCSTTVSPARVAWKKKKKKASPSSDVSTISIICWGRMALYLQSGNFPCVCVLTYIRVLFSWLDKHRKMTDLYCRAAVGVWHSKDQFQTVNKAWTRNTSQQNVTRPPSPHLLTLPPLCSALSSPVDIQRIVVPLFQFADRVTSFHNVLPRGDCG